MKYDIVQCRSGDYMGPVFNLPPLIPCYVLTGKLCTWCMARTLKFLVEAQLEFKANPTYITTYMTSLEIGISVTKYFISHTCNTNEGFHAITC